MADDNKANRSSVDSKQWSEYVTKLSSEDRERYVTKLKYREGTCCLPDPYSLRSNWVEDPSLWPQVTFTDIYFYLIDTPGQFTHESMRAYKSLKAYEYVESGHVLPIQYHKVEDGSPFCLLKTKVIPSQRLRDRPHQPWVYINKESGAVYCAHCTCMAGLGEVCSHVGALLFKVELAVRVGLTSKACTSEACKWNAAYRKQLEPTPVADAQNLFSGRRKKKVATVSQIGQTPLPDESTLQSLKEICPNAVFFKCIPPLDDEETESANEDVDSSSFPPTITSLTVHEQVDEDKLDSLCKDQWDAYACNPMHIKNLEETTRNQAICSLWYEHRKGRITGTKAHDIYVRKQSTDPSNLIKNIMNYGARDISKVQAIAWGINNESRARKYYTKYQLTQHVNFSCELAGLLISESTPFIGASSDGTVTCDCCGKGVLEIKCPYKHRESNIQTAAADEQFCLNKHLQLKMGHRYYTQIQLQMYVHNVSFCDFVIFTNVDMAVVRVSYNKDFCTVLVKKCEDFFMNFVLPEVITRKLQNCKPAASPTDTTQDVDEVWCLCQQEEFGRMIMCEGSHCSYTWFHYECVNIRRKPKGSWFCPSCIMQP